VPIPVLPTPADLRPSDNSEAVTARFVNGIQAPLDILFDGNLVATDLVFAEPTDTTLIKPGTYRVRAVPGGAGRDIAKVLYDGSLTLRANETVVIVISNSPGTTDKLQLSTFANNLKEIEKGSARLTFGMALSSRGGLTVSEGDKTLASLSNPGDAQEAQAITTGAHQFDFAQTGGATFKLPLTLAEQRAYLVLAVGDAKTAKAVVITDGAEREVQVRVLNASLNYQKNKQPLDVYVDSRLLSDDLAYGKATDFIKLPARFYQFRVRGGSDKPDAKPLVDLRYEPDSDHVTLVIYDGQNGLDFAVASEDFTPVPPTYARLVVVNVVPNTEKILLARAGVLNSQVRPVLFGASSPSTPILIGPSDFAFRTDSIDNPQLVENKQMFPVKEGTAYLYVAGASATRDALLLTTEIGTGVATLGGSTNPVVNPNSSGDASTPTPFPQMQVRFLNGLSDGTAATLKLDGRDLFTNVPAGKLTLPFRVTPKDVELALVGAKDAKVLRATRLQNTPRQAMLIIAVGTAGSPRLFQLGSNAPNNSDNAWLQVINGATGMASMRVEIAKRQEVTSTPSGGSSIDRGTPIRVTPVRILGQSIGTVPFGEFVADYPVAVGGYTLSVFDGSTGKLAATLDLDAVAGRRYDFLILPAAGGKIALNLFTTEDLTQP
jgi:hypothetical protein